jgi:hypothetical protein
MSEPGCTTDLRRIILRWGESLEEESRDPGVREHGGTFDDYLADNDTTAAPGDLNGDGIPDLLTVGDTTGLASELWQALGTGNSGLEHPG